MLNMSNPLTISDLVKGTNYFINLYKKYKYKKHRRILYINNNLKTPCLAFLRGKGNYLVDLDQDISSFFPVQIDVQNKSTFEILVKRKYKEAIFRLFSSECKRIIYVSSNKELVKQLFNPKRVKYFEASQIYKTTHQNFNDEDLKEVIEKNKITYNSDEDFYVKLQEYMK